MTASIPAIVVSGAPDNDEAAFLLVRYRINTVDDSNPWTYWPAVPVSAGGVVITGVAPGTVYDVEVGYRSIRGVDGSTWLPIGPATPGALTAQEIEGQGALATLDEVDTAQIKDRAAHTVGAIYSDTTITQVNSGNFANKLLELTVTVTGEPVILDIDLNEEVAGNAYYDYYLSIDSLVTASGGVASGFNERINMRAPGSGVVKGPRSIKRVLVPSAGSHTFRFYLVNTSGNSISITNRSMIVTELKKAD